MATVIHFGQVKPGKYCASSQSNYAALREELATLEVGGIFTATFTGRYGSRCARNALAQYCRHTLKYEVEASQINGVLTITRTK